MHWNAEGIDCDRMDWNPQFEDYYRRMDHKSAKKLQRLKQLGRLDSDAPSPASKGEDYGYVRSIIPDSLITQRH